MQAWSEIVLATSNLTRTALSFEFEILHIISDQLPLYSVHVTNINYPRTTVSTLQVPLDLLYESLASSPGILLYPAAPCPRSFYKMADDEAGFGVYQDKGNRVADRADQTSRGVDWGRNVPLYRGQ